MKSTSTCTSANEHTDLEQLEQSIVGLAAQLFAATSVFLSLLVEFDNAEGWTGWRSCAHWANWRMGIAIGTARENLRVGHALTQLPEISAAFSSGTISYSKARALTRIANPENESELLNLAKQLTASHLEKIVRLMRQGSADEEREADTQCQEKRQVTTYWDQDSMFVLRAKLTKEQGATVQKALDLAFDKLAQEETADDSLSSSQREADALCLVAQSALDHRLQTGTPADKTQVVVHVDHEALKNPTAEGLCSLEHQVRISPQTARRLACDASTVTVVDDASGNPLWSGRKQRVISTALRRVLLERDRCCQFPGCTNTKHLEGHHITHWAEGGHTQPDNLVLLCPAHHYQIHEGGVTLEKGASGEFIFQLPDGKAIPTAGVLPRIEDNPFDALPNVSAENLSCWNGDRVDVEWILWAFRTS